MKKVLFSVISCLLFISIYSQSDCNYDVNEIDQFNGKSKLYTKRYRVNDLELKIQFVKINSLRYVSFNTMSDLGCSSPYSNNRSYVTILLENKDKIKFN